MRQANAAESGRGEDRATRIASLLASATEILYGLGLGERVVAVSHECDYPPAASRKPRATSTRIAVQAAGREIDVLVREMVAAGAPLYEIDAPRLVALKPDLIVTQAQCDVCAVRYADVLALVRDQPALAQTEVVALNPTSLAEIYADILRVGEATGRALEARHWVAGLRERVEAVRARTEALAPRDRPRVACLEWIEPVMLAGNWMPELVELAGGVQPLTTPGKHTSYLAWQEVIAYDPQVIVVMPCGFDLARSVEEAGALGRWDGWRELAAVRQGRVYAVDGNAYFNRSGPRIIDSLEILARLIHPELFRPAECDPQPGIWRRLAGL